MPTGGTSSGASSGAVRAGGAYVEAFLKDNKLIRGLEGVKRRMAAFGSFMAAAGKVSGAAFSGLGHVLTSIGEKAKRLGLMITLPFLALTRGAMEKAKKGVFGPEAAETAERMSSAWDRILTAMQAAMMPILKALLPFFEKAADWAEKNPEMVRAIAMLGAGLLAGGVAASLLGGALSVVGSAIGIISSGMMVIVPLLSSQLGVGLLGLAAAATAATVAFFTLTETGRGMIQSFKDGFLETMNVARSSWAAIVADVSRGDLAHAMKVAGAALRYEWAKIDEFWTLKWIQFKDLFVDGWQSLVLTLKRTWNALTTGVALAMTYALDAVIWAFNQSIGRLAKGAAWLLEKAGADDTARSLREGVNIEPLGDGVRQDIWNQGQRDDREMVGKFEADKAGRRQFRDAQAAAVRAETQGAFAEWAAMIDESAKLKSESMSSLVKVQPTLAHATKGLFQAPNWMQALGIGDKVASKQLKAAEEGNKKLAAIDRKLGNMGMIRIA